jgi:class 3 adenylate cyclase
MSTSRLRTGVVLFADISGSSRLYQELGDAPALRRVRSCLTALCQAVEQNGGRVVKTMGDGLMSDFPDADRALQAAEAMQVAVADGAPGGLDIHVGCHLGQVIENAGDLFGDTVNTAARVAGLAGAGQIIVTLETVERLSQSLQRNVRQLDQVGVKGRQDPVTIFEYLWRQHGDLTVVGMRPFKLERARLRISAGEREVWLDHTGSGAVVLGRAAGCQVTVANPEASRQHATIEIRGDKFVLVDHSSNGTFVAWEGANETCLKREEMILPPRGRIALGVSTLVPDANVLVFSRER